PTTSTGVDEDVFVPLPSEPELLSPQHFTAPLGESEQAWSAPSAIDAAGIPPVTVSGGESVVVPLPSCPNELAPQQTGTPKEMEHANSSPAKTPSLMLTGTRTGVALNVPMVGDPSSPRALSPQQ